MSIYKLLSLLFFNLITVMGMCQVKVMQTKLSTSMSDALNKPSALQASNQNMNKTAYGSVLPGSVSAVSVIAGCQGANCQDITIRYEVPGFVVLDRVLLAGNLQNKIANLLDEQQQWQNMPNASDQTKQQMVNLIQNQINQLQGIEDGLQNDCKTVDFKDYPTRINADVRYNDPVSGSMTLMQANGSGTLNVSDLFNGIPFSALEGNPVKATLMIYKK